MSGTTFRDWYCFGEEPALRGPALGTAQTQPPRKPESLLQSMSNGFTTSEALLDELLCVPQTHKAVCLKPWVSHQGCSQHDSQHERRLDENGLFLLSPVTSAVERRHGSPAQNNRAAGRLGSRVNWRQKTAQGPARIAC